MATPLVIVPLVVTLVGAHYGVWLGFLRAPEQEVAAQRGVAEAKDRRLGRKPPVLARVKRIFPADGWSWVFTEPLPRQRIDSLATVVDEYLYGEHNADGTTPAQAMRDAGGRRIGNYCIKTCHSASRYKVTLTGHRRKTVDIIGLRTRKVGEKPSPTGTLLKVPAQGFDSTKRTVVDLDTPRSPFLQAYPERGETRPLLDVNTFTLALGESQGIELIALTDSCWCLWEIVVTVAYEGHTEEIVIRSDGTATGPPFETIAWSSQEYGTQRNDERPGGEFYYNFNGEFLPMSR